MSHSSPYQASTVMSTQSETPHIRSSHQSQGSNGNDDTATTTTRITSPQSTSPHDNPPKTDHTPTHSLSPTQAPTQPADQQASESQSLTDTQIPLPTQSQHLHEPIPLYPYMHRIDTRALLTDEITGEDIEFVFPVYICTAQPIPVHESAVELSQARGEYGRSARIMENWRGRGGRWEVGRGGHSRNGDRTGNGSGNVLVENGDGDGIGDSDGPVGSVGSVSRVGNERNRSAPWRRGMGLMRGSSRDGLGRGGRGDWRDGGDEGVSAGTGFEGDWVQVEHGQDADRSVNTNDSVEKDEHDSR